jgi:hypothetical protein
MDGVIPSMEMFSNAMLLGDYFSFSSVGAQTNMI